METGRLEPSAAIKQYQSLKEAYTGKVKGLCNLTGNIDRPLIFNTFQCYISVITNLAKLKWSVEHDY